MLQFDFLNSTCNALVCLSKLMISSPGTTCGIFIEFVIPGNFKVGFNWVLGVMQVSLVLLRGFFGLLNSLNLLMRLRIKASYKLQTKHHKVIVHVWTSELRTPWDHILFVPAQLFIIRLTAVSFIIFCTE